MEKIIREIKNQQEVNFMNVKNQIDKADLETVFDAESNSRYIFHYLHSMDKFFINPNVYVYEGERLFGIPENYSVIDAQRIGYQNDSSIVISREQLSGYFEYVKNKIENYFETLTAENLLEKPESCEYTRLGLILAQFRHLMWHVGLSTGISYASKKEWEGFTGLKGLSMLAEE